MPGTVQIVALRAVPDGRPSGPSLIRPVLSPVLACCQETSRGKWAGHRFLHKDTTGRFPGLRSLGGSGQGGPPSLAPSGSRAWGPKRPRQGTGGTSRQSLSPPTLFVSFSLSLLCLFPPPSLGSHALIPFILETLCWVPFFTTPGAFRHWVPSSGWHRGRLREDLGWTKSSGDHAWRDLLFTSCPCLEVSVAGSRWVSVREFKMISVGCGLVHPALSLRCPLCLQMQDKPTLLEIQPLSYLVGLKRINLLMKVSKDLGWSLEHHNF